MSDALTTGLAVRAVIWSIIAGLLVRHAVRNWRLLAVASGPRFPQLYLWFGAIFALAALESAIATAWPESLARIGVGMASDLCAIITIDRLARSQAESVQHWQRPEWSVMVARVSDAAQALATHLQATDERGADG